jgi:hypothetical protein
LRTRRRRHRAADNESERYGKKGTDTAHESQCIR